MKIEYDSYNQGVLICKDIDRESIDNLTLKMICNNKINGLASVEYIQNNTKCELKYYVSEMTTADKVLTNEVNKSDLLKLLSGILDSVANIGDYMIDRKNILLDTKYIFVNEKDYNVDLICLPLTNIPENDNMDLFLKKLMVNTTFNQSENCDYVASIINFLNQSDNVSLKDLKQLINSLTIEADSDKAQENTGGNTSVNQGNQYINNVDVNNKEVQPENAQPAITPVHRENRQAYVQKVNQPVNNGQQAQFQPANNIQQQQQPMNSVQPQQSQRLAPKPVTPQHMNVQPTSAPQNQQGGNFGETTVLNAAASSDTTVLNPGMLFNNMPYVIRKKTGERIDIDKPVFRIGKEKSYVDYFIGDNSAISRSHANILTKEDKYYIIDTNSTNHTFIEGQMIPPNKEIQLASGQMIKLANEEFEFHIG